MVYGEKRMRKITFRIWILIIIVMLSLISIFSIPPTFLEKGIEVSSVTRESKIFEDGLRKHIIITHINGEPVNSIQEYSSAINYLRNTQENETAKMTITTKDFEIVGLYNSSIINDIAVKEIPPTRIKMGLDLQGGARAIVKADVPLTDDQLADLISVSEQRLNVYGLTDVRFFRVITSSQERLMGIEIAGSSPSDLEDLIAKQGKFEAKIGDNVVFIGGDKDVVHVARTASEGAGVYDCRDSQEGSICYFRFPISISESAATRFADITKNLSVNGSHLSETIDFLIDDKVTNSLSISSGLKGKAETQISIQGSGSGATRQDALNDAKTEMKKLQTILITGSLPYQLEIVKIDRISANLGDTFIKQILLAGAFALVAVSLVVFFRYRKVKIFLAMAAISISEVIIILGTAALMGINLDLPSIAGIIAVIGTGIDSQLIILDESTDKHEALIKRIKKALFIIVIAFTTTTVAMIPLTGLLGFMGIGATSAGLLKGFAYFTIIGLLVGVLISRPAFADMIKNIQKD
jgi:preprotein translocase subunit SecD